MKRAGPKKRGRGDKISKAQQLERLEWVEDHLTMPRELLLSLWKRTFKAGPVTLDRYLAEARARWEHELATPAAREAKRLEIERKADRIYRDARDDGKHGAALAVLDLKAKLHGLYREETAAVGDVTVVFECEPHPTDVPAPGDVAPGGDPPRDGAAPGAGRGEALR